MTWQRTIRTLACGAALVLCVAAADAQRGPGGPGGGGGSRGTSGASQQPGAMGQNFTTTRPEPGNHMNAPLLSPPGRWWNDKRMAHTLNLRTEQQKRMDEIWNGSKGNLINLYSNLEREEQKMSSMSREDLQDEAKVFAAIDRVAKARAEVEKENARITLQLRKELDATQTAALDRQIALSQ